MCGLFGSRDRGSGSRSPSPSRDRGENEPAYREMERRERQRQQKQQQKLPYQMQELEQLQQWSQMQPSVWQPNERAARSAIPPKDKTAQIQTRASVPARVGTLKGEKDVKRKIVPMASYGLKPLEIPAPVSPIVYESDFFHDCGCVGNSLGKCGRRTCCLFVANPCCAGDPSKISPPSTGGFPRDGYSSRR